MDARADGLAISTEDGARLIEASFSSRAHILLAVSGGADSMALLALAADWSQGDPSRRLSVATVDHGLRPEARDEIASVAAAARALGLDHTTLPGPLPSENSRIEQRAREIRYAALVAHARAIQAEAIATAHTLDDQAETVLMRLAAGSGPAGLAAMRPARSLDGIEHLRPLLGVAKTRLVATLEARGIGWSEDAMNRDPRFARARLREARAALEREGLTATRLGALAARMARIDDAIERAVTQAIEAHVAHCQAAADVAADASRLPEEIRLRLLGRLIARLGGGVVRLERLERLVEQIADTPSGAATLGGARIAWRADGSLRVTSAPARRPHGA